MAGFKNREEKLWPSVQIEVLALGNTLLKRKEKVYGMLADWTVQACGI